MRSIRQRKAFTIIEMVIVIAVIAILATVLVPTISGVIQRANVAADQQFAASLNVQLAMYSVDDPIESESDLRDAINSFYGTEENPDFYATLAPKSGDQGYHYWWNATDEQLVLAKYEDLLGEPDPSEPTLVAEIENQLTFSAASPRSLTIDGKNFFLMDQGGSDMGEVLKSFETLEDPQDYEDLLNDLDEIVTDGDALAALIQQKIEVTAIVTDYGVFRYGVESVAYVHIPLTVKELNSIVVYEYNADEQEVSDGIENGKITTRTDIQIELPAGTKVNVGGLTGLFNSDDNTDLKTDTPEIHVNATEEELKDIFEAASTDCIIVLSDGSRYIMEGGDIYRLPRTEDDTPAVGGLGIDSVEKIEINYKDSSDVRGEDCGYFYQDTLYLAYDMGSAQLSLAQGISSSMVDWTVSVDAPIAVSPSGVITVVDDPDALKTTATVTATLKGDTSKTDSITVQLIFPTTITWTLDTADKSAPMLNAAFDLIYTDTTEFALAWKATGYTQTGYVKMNSEPTIKFDTSGNLFKVENGVLTLDPTAIKPIGTNTQELTVTYGTTDNTYVSQTYTITVIDNSAAPFEVNKIVDKDGEDNDIEMGETYLFRVGNANSIALSKLFNTDKAPANLTLTIYDAAKSLGEGKWSEIATSGGFSATYTSELTKDTWASSTIQFTGTGVAIIEITTTEGTATLAVEVVGGKNVTSAGDFSGATNYVVLNDIAWGSTKDIAISGTIYGNGFAINATTYLPAVSGNTAMFNLSGGTIDNLVINGPVYPELSYSGKEYYIAGIYATGNAKITNSYIAGFRSPITANGSSLYLENTTLVGGNYANLWLQTGSLTLQNVTTVQKETNATIGDTPTKVLGAGIIANSGINASNVTIIGDLTQYNWVSKDQASSYMDDDVSSLINTFYSNTTITHSVNGTKYINTGIVFQGTTGTVNNASQTAGHGYTTETVSGKLMSETISGNIYTRTTTAGTIASIPTYGGGYTPNAQAALKPTFSHKLTLENGAYNISINVPDGETYVLDVSGYSVSKYTDQAITVNISCTGVDGGVTQNGYKFTFSKAGNYTLTYTVEDNTFYKNDGSRYEATVTDTYTVKVAVSNSNHPNAVINGANTAKTSKWVTTGNALDKNYQAWFELLSGVTITDYNEDGTSFTVTPTSTDLKGLSIAVTSGTQYAEITGISTDEGYWMYDKKDNDGNTTAYSVKFTYTYTGKNNKTVTATYTATLAAGTDEDGKVCVTSDTLVTLADGTQKEIQYVTYEDELLVWNFFTGDYDAVPSSIIFYHGDDVYKVLSLNFSDGTTVKVINNHGFFDMDKNEWAFIHEGNAANYVGHRFVKIDGENYTTVTLDSYSVAEEYTGSYSVQTAMHNNFMVEGMFSITLPEYEGWFDYFEIGDNLKYDEEKMQADIEKYGLYDYEEFAEYVTYEQFMAFSGPYLKVLVGRGVVTYEQILDLIARYVPQ